MAENRYFYIPPERISKGTGYLKGAEFHHLAHVTRIKGGDKVHILDGEGGVYEGAVVSAGKEEAVINLTNWEQIERPDYPDIALPVIKGPRMELAVEKCTEIGVAKIVPFICERTVWRGGKDEFINKRKRLRRKVISACKQSVKPYFPPVTEPVTLEELTGSFSAYDRVLLADSDGDFITEYGDSAGKLLGIVGPEGGLTDSEKRQLSRRGASLISLGVSRLRSETAAMGMVFYMNYLSNRIK